jgi:hypothetical protein
MKYIETADDDTQKQVIIKKQPLKKIEQSLEVLGFKEADLNPVVHHFLVGGLAYLNAAPVSGMTLVQTINFIRNNKQIFAMFIKNLDKKLATKEQEKAKI